MWHVLSVLFQVRWIPQSITEGYGQLTFTVWVIDSMTCSHVSCYSSDKRSALNLYCTLIPTQSCIHLSGWNCSCGHGYLAWKRILLKDSQTKLKISVTWSRTTAFNLQFCTRIHNHPNLLVLSFIYMQGWPKWLSGSGIAMSLTYWPVQTHAYFGLAINTSSSQYVQ